MFSDVLLRNPIVLNQEQKKKQHNVQIKNNNPKEPKIKQNIKYSAKQSYRRYKTITEPNLHSKIMVDDGDDMVSKIQEAFGIKPKSNSNFTKAETAEALHNKGLDYMPPNEGLNDNSMEAIIADMFGKVEGKMKEGQMSEEDVAKWGTAELMKRGIGDADFNRIAEKMHKKKMAELEKKLESVKDRINKEGSHVINELDPEEFGGKYSQYWAGLQDTVWRKQQKESERADLFEGIDKSVLESIIGEVEAEYNEEVDGIAKTISENVLNQAVAEIDDERPEEIKLKEVQRERLTSPLKGKFLKLVQERGAMARKSDVDNRKARKTDVDDREKLLSAKTTEAGSLALENERAAAIRKPRGRPALPATIARRQREAEEAERKRIAKEYGAKS